MNSLSERVLAELRSTHGDAPAAAEERADRNPSRDDVDRLMDELSDAELRELLAELEAQTVEPKQEGAQP